MVLQCNLDFVLCLIKGSDRNVTLSTERLTSWCRVVRAFDIGLQLIAETVHCRGGRGDRIIDAVGQFWRASFEQTNALLKLATEQQLEPQQAVERTAHRGGQALSCANARSDTSDLTGHVDFPGHTNGTQVDQKQRRRIIVQHQTRGGRYVVDKVERLRQLLVPLSKQIVRRQARFDTFHQ
ncbi:hypothetical protein ALP79_200157 [Pseudomonas savastanoi pv. fraxini]|nr:hypothetical protein ALP79_200157 [Pseudomonas savastanoi pv. fraxini]